MHSLPLFLRLGGRTVILVGEGEAADAKRRLLERAGATVTDDESADAVIALVALDGPAADQAAMRLKARGLLVNVVDRPELCDFTTPAIVDRDPVLIAIGTGGASAGLAKHLRLRMEALLPPGLGKLATGLATARPAIRQRFPDNRERRQAIDRALAPGGMLDPMTPPAESAIAAWLAAPAEMIESRDVRVIDVTSDDPDDLTLRTARLLGEADVVIHDRRISPAVLARARADAAVFCDSDDTASHTGLIVVLRRVD
jgi:uroporphyrin-III C-methyltransferase/precorrin-2 dehydrogenase/sirohydrochlorin ferrochelatase